MIKQLIKAILMVGVVVTMVQSKEFELKPINRTIVLEDGFYRIDGMWVCKWVLNYKKSISFVKIMEFQKVNQFSTYYN